MLTISDLIIEVTRRCNLRCEHCLRGEAQNVDFNPDYLREFLRINEVEYVSCLTLTGGEPSLAPEVIQECLSVLEQEGVEVGNFYIATNGTTPLSKLYKFLSVVIDLYAYCSENEISTLALSNSEYHEAQGAPNPQVVEKLEAFRFFSQRARLADEYLLAEGRATEFGCRPVKPETYSVNDSDSVQDGPVHLGGLVYLNALGQIVPGCDFSYETQKKLALGTCRDKLLEILPLEEE